MEYSSGGDLDKTSQLAIAAAAAKKNGHGGHGGGNGDGDGDEHGTASPALAPSSVLDDEDDEEEDDKKERQSAVVEESTVMGSQATASLPLPGLGRSTTARSQDGDGGDEQSISTSVMEE